MGSLGYLTCWRSVLSRILPLYPVTAGSQVPITRTAKMKMCPSLSQVFATESVLVISSRVGKYMCKDGTFQLQGRTVCYLGNPQRDKKPQILPLHSLPEHFFLQITAPITVVNARRTRPAMIHVMGMVGGCGSGNGGKVRGPEPC